MPVKIMSPYCIGHEGRKRELGNCTVVLRRRKGKVLVLPPTIFKVPPCRSFQNIPPSLEDGRVMSISVSDTGYTMFVIFFMTSDEEGCHFC